jgi:hypothetical protein
MAQIDCPVTIEQCTYCTDQAKPCQSINVVTVSIAFKYTKDKASVASSYGKLLNIVPVSLKENPGTELKNLISWFVWDKKVRNCTICKNREERMNRWGADNCEKNIATIIGWLQESAKEKGYPFSSRVASVLVKKAIANSRKK